MMDVLLNPVQLQAIPKQELKRLQLQKERTEEMKRFLAQQASNSHPRLVKLLKKHENPSGPITETSMFPKVINAQENIQPTRPSMMSPSIQTSTRPSANVELPPIQQQTLPTNTNQQQQQFQQKQQQFQQQQFQQQYIPLQPRDSIYGFPAVFQYPTMQYHPNPYLPPFHYSPYASSHTKADQAYSDPYSHHYSSTPYFSQPQMLSQQQSSLPRPTQHPPGQSMFPFSTNQYNNQGENGNANRNEQHERRQQNNRNSQNSHVPRRNRFGKPEVETKEEYAADLERQIAEKNERKNREKIDRIMPGGGFLGMGKTSPAPPAQQRQKQASYRYHDESLNDGYESANSNAQKQSRYLRELDEQIRIKKELKQKEMEVFPNSNFSQPLQPQSPNIYMADLYDSKASRKQFPNETAKIWNSTVFPSSPMRSPQILNKYSTLPAIGNNSTEDFIRQNLGKLSGFPPSVNLPSGDMRASPNPPTFLRGTINLDSLTDWQKDELRLREEGKRKNQKEIQDVLKLQIAQKEMEKQKQKENQRLEDEKEMRRIEKEQAVLKERYAREKEEAQRKAEEEKLEKEKAIAEKKARRQKMEEEIPVPLKAKKVIRLPSPDQSHEVSSSQPFRSNSPPLPAVLKRMKEEGYSEEKPSVQASQETISSLQTISSNSDNLESFDSLSKSGEYDIHRKANNQSRQSKATIRRDRAPFEDDNAELLAQLQAIQRELQNEDIKVQNDLKREPLQPSITQTEKIRFENDLKEIDNDINNDDHFHSQRLGKTPHPPSAPPRRDVKSSHQFRRYREVHTPKDVPPTPAINYRPPPTRQLETESQILDISRNIQMLSQDFATEPKDDPFNIDEIEKLNEMRLRKLEDQAAQKHIHGKNRDLLADFMSNGVSDSAQHSRYQDRSIPTSPSTFQPLPFNYEL